MSWQGVVAETKHKNPPLAPLAKIFTSNTFSTGSGNVCRN